MVTRYCESFFVLFFLFYFILFFYTIFGSCVRDFGATVVYAQRGRFVHLRTNSWACGMGFMIKLSP